MATQLNRVLNRSSTPGGQRLDNMKQIAEAGWQGARDGYLGTARASARAMHTMGTFADGVLSGAANAVNLPIHRGATWLQGKFPSLGKSKAWQSIKNAIAPGDYKLISPYTKWISDSVHSIPYKNPKLMEAPAVRAFNNLQEAALQAIPLAAGARYISAAPKKALPAWRYSPPATKTLNRLRAVGKGANLLSFFQPVLGLTYVPDGASKQDKLKSNILRYTREGLSFQTVRCTTHSQSLCLIRIIFMHINPSQNTYGGRQQGLLQRLS